MSGSLVKESTKFRSPPLSKLPSGFYRARTRWWEGWREAWWSLKSTWQKVLSPGKASLGRCKVPPGSTSIQCFINLCGVLSPDHAFHSSHFLMPRLGKNYDHTNNPVEERFKMLLHLNTNYVNYDFFDSFGRNERSKHPDLGSSFQGIEEADEFQRRALLINQRGKYTVASCGARNYQCSRALADKQSQIVRTE